MRIVKWLMRALSAKDASSEVIMSAIGYGLGTQFLDAVTAATLPTGKNLASVLTIKVLRLNNCSNNYPKSM